MSLYEEAVQLIQEFSDRVDRGEVRSVKTKAKFDAFLLRAKAAKEESKPKPAQEAIDQ